MNTTPLQICLALALSLSGASAGPVDPPAGPVGPTMKTLDEVEARIPLTQETAPGDGDAAFVITQPGSYYLTRAWTISGSFDLPSGTITPRDGIRIEADNVTLDLNGYALTGGLFTPRNGIIVPNRSGSVSSVSIHGGTVDGFTENGISIEETVVATIDDLTVKECENGVVLDRGSVTDSRFVNNEVYGITSGGIQFPVTTALRCVTEGGSRGIRARMALDCTVSGFAQFGIFADVVLGCSAIDTLGSATGACISAKTAENCTTVGGLYGMIVDGSATGCRAQGATTGFWARNGGSVRDSLATQGVTGLLISDGARATGCEATNNTGSGFIVQGRGSRLENNHAYDNSGVGFEITGSDNVLRGNTAGRNNQNNWDVAAGNHCLVVLLLGAQAFSGNDGGNFTTSNDPMANYTH